MKPETWNRPRQLLIGLACALALAGLVAGGSLTLGWLPSDDETAPATILTPTLSVTSQAHLPYIEGRPFPTSTSIPIADPPPRPTPIPIAEALLVRGPYLQSVTSGTVVVVWETDRLDHGEVAYGVTDVYDSRAADPAASARHAVMPTGLAPYTAYHYRVESGGALLSEELTFRTAASPDQTAFTFAIFGDTRTQHEKHRAVVERIIAQAPDLALHTGDLVEFGGVAQEWETFFGIERELIARVPLFPVLGNHEGNDPLYFDLFYLPGNERWYTFDYGAARFVCLEVDGSADFGPGSEQYAWLEETLAANTRPWLFVVFHVPPYTSVKDSLEAAVRRALTPLFERHGVDVVFSSHKHNYERNEVNGVTYIVTGGGGAPLYALQKREPTQATFAMEHHFVVVRIDGERLEATVISIAGEVLDTFERSAE